VMYQTMNFNPPAPKTLNPDLPEVLNFIAAKALAKNLDDRYQNAKDLAHDLREAIVSSSGQYPTADMLGMPAQSSPVAPAAAPLTRQQDKAEQIFAAAGAGLVPEADAGSSDPGDPSQKQESTQPSLGLAEAFDNFSATMRLAALTGTEKELDKFSETQKIARLKALADAKRSGVNPPTQSDSSTWQQPGASLKAIPIGPISGGGMNLKLVWAGSAVLAVATVALLLLR
ncbi:MAG TPA: hypothetical protein VIU02_05345, partial [Burkholderiales bacterium]